MTTTAAKSPDQLRKEALARHDIKVLRLEDMLQRFLQLLDHQLTALKTECFDEMGYKALMADPKLLTKIKDLGAAFNSATDSKVRLDKTAKDRAKEMSPEDEEAAVREWIRSRANRDRGNFLWKEVEYHNKAKFGMATAKELTPPSLEGQEE